MPRYSWNIANVGVNHQSIDPFFEKLVKNGKLSSVPEVIYCNVVSVYRTGH